MSQARVARAAKAAAEAAEAAAEAAEAAAEAAAAAAEVAMRDKAQVHLTVRTPKGVQLRLDVNCGDTIQSVKQCIVARMDSAEDDFYLIFQGSEIEDHRKISDYSVRNSNFGSTSTLAMRCRKASLDRSEEHNEHKMLARARTAYF
ncbi:unnamed protein product [Polarella glacialis]|uniref:Ubiquitin-like domain-containing protein n=1 Tax=Polarella glacialis TaxID=89957 RepID=A0A813E2S7_POLGL|nr:unnamed protein product [Polarella glacialis]CAE8593100.1 unnamed protein product [Polarella glacialis]